MMKKIFVFFLMFLVILPSVGRTGFSVEAADANLVLNSSVEQTDASGQPQGWQSNSWGENVPEHSLVPGYNSNTAVSVKLSSHLSGDAKWYFAPVAVTGGAQYQFSDWYRSDAATELVAQCQDDSGNYTYQWIATIPPAGDWQKTGVKFTPSSSVKSLTVFHLINSVGYLTIDEVSLIKSTPAEPVVISDNVPNNSLEQVAPDDQSRPAAWSKNSWGVNSAVFSYQNTGHDGLKSVKVEITGYSSGDAKWYFEPVALQSGAEYQFIDYYQSSVPTEVVARHEDSAGNYTYQWLGTAPAAAGWTKLSLTFTVPNNAAKTTVFHLINSVGYLATDSYAIKEIPPVIITGNVPNSSLEQVSSVNPNMPADWHQNFWGSNRATFSYLNEGHTGSRSVKVQIRRYTDGDAKWYFTPQPLAPNTTYQISDWYKSNTTSRVVLMVTKTDGSVQYQELKNTPPAADWTNYRDIFTTPANTATVSVLHLISAVGFLITDDYAITPYTPTGFSRPVVSLTFDDGWEENHATMLPVLARYGFKSTQYYATTFIENNPAEQHKIIDFANAGHEIGSHSVTHPALPTLSDADLHYELTHSKSVLENLVGAGKINHFATPYGAYDFRVITAIRDYYASHRSTDAGYNTRDSLDVNNLRVQNVLYNTTIEEYQSWLDKAAADNAWLILVYHRISDNPGTYDSYQSDFASQMAALNLSGLSVQTVSSALAELLPQTAN